MNKAGTLLDAGPIVALLNHRDSCHLRAKEVLSKLTKPFLTCEAVLSEACFLANRIDTKAPEEVLKLGQEGFYTIDFDLRDHIDEVSALFKKYRDQGISLADACLIRMAEFHNQPQIFTFDSDFEIYRWGRKQSFLILGS